MPKKHQQEMFTRERQKSQIWHNTNLRIDYSTQDMTRNTKIVCTIGPKTQSVEALKALMGAGMNVARMNFSHGSHEYHYETIKNVRLAADELKQHIGIALDTKGPEIRTGMFSAGEVTIRKGATVVLTTDESVQESGTAEMFYVDYKNIGNVVKVGGFVFIDDGILRLEIKAIEGNRIVTESCNDHTISSRRGVNLPGAPVDLPAVSEKDKADLAFGVQHDLDFVFASFIREAKQVNHIRECLGEAGKHIRIISKIENHQGVENIDSIIEASDGIMVARGDLGIEIPAEKVFLAQKMMISKCNIAGKPVICATQMLESMTFNPRPTRAEVSDVANAVLDGADAVMLSGETAKGLYPTEVVQYMDNICKEAQSALRPEVVFHNIKDAQPIPMKAEDSICSSAVNSVTEIAANAIVVLSNTGRSAQLLAKYRPPCPIFMVSELKTVCRGMTISRAVVPVFYDRETRGLDLEREKRVHLGIQVAKDMAICDVDDHIIAVHADQNTKGFANQTRVVVVQ